MKREIQKVPAFRLQADSIVPLEALSITPPKFQLDRYDKGSRWKNEKALSGCGFLTA